MSSSPSEAELYPPLDLQATLADNRLLGLWRLIQGFRAIYVGAVVALAIAAIFKTLTYMLLRYFVDDVLLQPEAPFPYGLIAVGFVLLAAFEGSFTFLSGRLAAQSSEGVTLRLRNYLFDHLQRLPVSYHDQIKTGDLIQRCSSDVDALRRFLAQQSIGIGRIGLLFSINFATLLTLNVKLSFLTIMFIPIVVLVSYFFFKQIHASYEAHQEQEGKLSANLQENLSGVRVVKAFARQQFEMDKFEQGNWSQYQKGRRLVLLHSLFWPLVEGLSLFQWLIVMYFGALMVLNQELTIGTYLAFIGLSVWIIFPMQGLGRLIVQLSEGMVSYQRVAEIIRQHRELEDSTTLTPAEPVEMVKSISNGHNGHHNAHKPMNRQGEVIFDNVSLAYGDNAPVLQTISFVVEPGQTIALLGPTGAGKSSLINLLPRFYDYTSGQIWLDGLPLREYTLSDLRQRIGIVQQEPFLFSRTIAENIAYGVKRELCQDDIEAAARMAAIHEVILTFPKQYNTLVGEKGVTLSGGQKQRVAIARTLLKNPHILVFDDAVSAVDTETEQLIQKALEELRHGRTTFIIAHRIQTIMRADKILVLDKGRIVQQGSHAELLAQEGIYQQIYNLQAQIDMEV